MENENEYEIDLGEIFKIPPEEEEEFLKKTRREIWEYWENQIRINEHEKVKAHLVRHGGLGKRNFQLYLERNRKRLSLSNKIQSIHRNGVDIDELFEILPILDMEEIESFLTNEP
jgi:hypothetical protein